jgi:uncharacterized membrane protein YgcG
VIDDLTGSAAPVPLVERMARQQYAALPAPGRASAQNNAEPITSYDARIVIEHNGVHPGHRADHMAHADQAPSWYQAGEPFSPGTLSSLSRSGYYFSSMHHFATNTSSWIASASQAASSGGSGSSGFSGGSFSGGGGGGGGGGSW